MCLILPKQRAKEYCCWLNTYVKVSVNRLLNAKNYICYLQNIHLIEYVLYYCQHNLKLIDKQTIDVSLSTKKIDFTSLHQKISNSFWLYLYRFKCRAWIWEYLFNSSGNINFSNVLNSAKCREPIKILYQPTNITESQDNCFWHPASHIPHNCPPQRDKSWLSNLVELHLRHL